MTTSGAVLEFNDVDSPTSVRLDYWEKAQGDVPVITSPWGETVQPYVVHNFGRT